MKTVNATKVLCDTALLRETLPETINSLFKMKMFDKVESIVRLKHNESIYVNNRPMMNPYKNIEILLFLPKDVKPYLICACSMN